MNREHLLQKLEIPITGRAAKVARISTGPQRLACAMASVQHVCRGDHGLIVRSCSGRFHGVASAGPRRRKKVMNVGSQRPCDQ
jgi:hypothetical protein